MRRCRLHLARILRRLACHLDADQARPYKIEWNDGRKLTLPPGSTLEQAMDLVARLDEFSATSSGHAEFSGGPSE